nr:hypothetical protein [Streptomyces sp. CC228A]
MTTTTSRTAPQVSAAATVSSAKASASRRRCAGPNAPASRVFAAPSGFNGTTSDQIPGPACAAVPVSVPVSIQAIVARPRRAPAAAPPAGARDTAPHHPEHRRRRRGVRCSRQTRGMG